MKFSALPYQLFSRLPFCDVSTVYVLDCAPGQDADKYGAGMIVRQLSAEALLKLTAGAVDFNAEDARKLAKSANCLAAFLNDRLVGYVWFRGGHIPADMNTPGAPFRGFDLELAESAQYLFKVYVDEQYRGHRVNQFLCQALGRRIAAQGQELLVTLTAWDNTAFRKSAERMGFRSIGQCVEWTFKTKSFYLFAKEDASVVRYAAPYSVGGRRHDDRRRWSSQSHFRPL